jgi:predicted DNA-binding transcriptional regulator AlpA
MNTQTAPRTQPPATLPDSGYIRISALIKIIPFSASTVWRKAKNGTFPKPYKLSAQITAFKIEDVRAWMASTEASNGQGG